MNDSDRARDDWLVLRCQQGDPEGFDMLVRRWQKPLLNYAFRLTGSTDTAQDAVQETWLVVIKGLVGLKDLTRFRSWVYRVLHHKCQDHWRRHHRDAALAAVVGTETAELAATPRPGEKADLQSALAGLDQDSRAVLVLKYVEDFNVAEMAEVLNVPPGTVKSRLHSARQKLREAMGEA
jgi:RNA polymerase sigma factor (sigma-70 family)